MSQSSDQREIKELKQKIIIRNQTIKDIKRALCDCIKYIIMSNNTDAENFPIEWCFNTNTETDKAFKNEILNIKNEKIEHHFIQTNNNRLIKISGFVPDVPELISVKCTYAEILNRLERLENNGMIEKQQLNCWIIHCINDDLIKELTTTN